LADDFIVHQVKLKALNQYYKTYIKSFMTKLKKTAAMGIKTISNDFIGVS
jgi:hypothetical protein